MHPKPIVFFDEKHVKQRAYRQQYMSNPENREKVNKSRRDHFDPVKNKERQDRWDKAHPGFRKEIKVDWRIAHPGYYTEKKAEWRGRVGLKNSLDTQKWLSEHPGVQEAQTAARNHVDLPEFCEVCPEDDQNKATSRHHPDYTYPLIIVGCCVACHYYLNKERSSQEQKKEKE